MWWDQQFTPGQHGDLYERLWWHFLEDDFPEWGRFWAHHVVPLTNRIVDDFGNDHPAKLFIRYDPKINNGLEALAMRNYSVFYFLARSCAIVSSEPHLFPEDVFIFLRATTENVSQFLNIFSKRIAPIFGIDEDKLPKWVDIKNTQTARQILGYRDAFVHSGQVGRNPDLPWEYIPSYPHISEAKNYWRYVQNLPKGEFVESRTYLSGLQKDLMKNLNVVWNRTTELLDKSRTSEAYGRYYRLFKDAGGKLRPINWKP